MKASTKGQVKNNTKIAKMKNEGKIEREIGDVIQISDDQL